MENVWKDTWIKHSNVFNVDKPLRYSKDSTYKLSALALYCHALLGCPLGYISVDHTITTFSTFNSEQVAAARRLEANYMSRLIDVRINTTFDLSVLEQRPLSRTVVELVNMKFPRSEYFRVNVFQYAEQEQEIVDAGQPLEIDGNVVFYEDQIALRTEETEPVSIDTLHLNVLIPRNIYEQYYHVNPPASSELRTQLAKDAAAKKARQAARKEAQFAKKGATTTTVSKELAEKSAVEEGETKEEAEERKSEAKEEAKERKSETKEEAKERKSRAKFTIISEMMEDIRPLMLIVRPYLVYEWLMVTKELMSDSRFVGILVIPKNMQSLLNITDDWYDIYVDGDDVIVVAM